MLMGKSTTINDYFMVLCFSMFVFHFRHHRVDMPKFGFRPPRSLWPGKSEAILCEIEWLKMVKKNMWT